MSEHQKIKKKSFISAKKSGFFDAEIEFYRSIACELNIHALNEEKTVFARHPFVFLVEAADDICYRIIDLEDAHRLNIISIQEARNLLEPFFENQEGKKSINEKVDTIEYVSYERDENGLTGKILIATGEGWESNYKILKRLNSVPAEYRKIEGYDWFTGNFK